MPNIELRNVSRIFPPDIVAVDDISFKINSGEYVFMLGPSGCGKTTTLRLISGLDHPTNGKIFIDNKLRRNTPVGINLLRMHMLKMRGK